MTSEPKKTQPEKSTIGKRIFPNLDENSSAMPSDKWIVETIIDVVKKDESLKKNIEETMGSAAMSATTVAAGITGVFALCTVAPPAILASGVIAAAFGAKAFAEKSQQNFQKIKTENLPKVQKEIALRYIKMSGEKAQQKRLEERAKRQLDKDSQTPKL